MGKLGLQKPSTKEETITQSDLALLHLKNEIEVESVEREECDWWMKDGKVYHWSADAQGMYQWREVTVIP